ncbi:MAG: acyltransferase [Oscillospiraceae bacterium]|nr:acyltransferase [Candidatus Ruminococcus equi]
MYSKSQSQSFSTKKVLTYRNEIFGFSALMIIFYHLAYWATVPGNNFLPHNIHQVIELALNQGSIGVDIFLFLSAIGLYSSMSHNDIGTFYKNRIVRVVIPWLVITIPAFIWIDLVYAKTGVVSFILDTLTINYWITPDAATPWYVPAILILYAVYPLLYKADKSTKHIFTSVLIVLLIAVNILCTIYINDFYEQFSLLIPRLPVFFVGILVAQYMLDDHRIKWPFLLIVFIVTVLILALRFKVALYTRAGRLTGSILAIGIIFLYAFIRHYNILRYLGKLFGFIGKISLEVYLIQEFIFLYIKENNLWGMLHMYWWYLIVPIASVLIAKLISLLISAVKSAITNSKNKKQLAA